MARPRRRVAGMLPMGSRPMFSAMSPGRRLRKRRQRRARLSRGMQRSRLNYTVTDGAVVKQRYADGTEVVRGVNPKPERSWAVGPPAEMANTWQNKLPAGMGRLAGTMPVGTSEVGALAAVKALHPAADLGPQRWPDKTADTTVVLQNTDTWTFGSSEKDAQYPWSCAIWLTPFIDCPVIICRHSQDNNIPNPQTMNDGNTATFPAEATFQFFYSTPWGNAGAKHPGDEYQTARITARSLTVDLIANATNNQGMVYAGQFSPNIVLMPEVGGPNFKSMANVLAAVMHKLNFGSKELGDIKGAVGGGEILEYIGARMHDLKVGGDVSEDEDDESDDSDADSVDATDVRVGVSGGGLNKLDAPTGGQSGYRTVFQDWPYTPQQVVQMDPKCYTSTADQGVYMTLRHASDILQHTPTSTESYLSATVPHVENGNTSACNVLHSDGWTMGCVIFTSLDGKAALNLKCITALELSPRPDSQLAKFAEEAPPLDQMAIDHTRVAMGKLPSAFPACYNVLGSIVELIASALGSSNIPIVSQVANGALGINRALGGAGTKFLDGIF